MSWIAPLVGQLTVTAVGFIVIAFLLRYWVLTRLRASIRHEYAVELEGIRKTNAEILERVREDRASREALKASTLTALASMRSSALPQRMDAIQRLWNVAGELRKATPWYMTAVDLTALEECCSVKEIKEALKNADFIKVVGEVSKSSDELRSLRPFVGDHLFGLVTTLQTLIGRATFVTIDSYQKGSFKKWMADEHIRRMLEATLSLEEIATLDNMRYDQLSTAASLLEEKIAKAIDALLTGESFAAGSAEAASRVLAAAAAADAESEAQRHVG